MQTYTKPNAKLNKKKRTKINFPFMFFDNFILIAYNRELSFTTNLNKSTKNDKIRKQDITTFVRNCIFKH